MHEYWQVIIETINIMELWQKGSQVSFRPPSYAVILDVSFHTVCTEKHFYIEYN